ncbi:MAG TPA: response regulator [Xanthobacteraceae bacterium]|jgi:CheY-like chemotaxis protein
MIHLHVLYTAAEPDIGQIIELSLARDPFFVVRGATSGAEALAAAIEWRPDLMLLDVMMPQMDAPTALARLRADKRTAAIPVIFVTGRARRNERKKLRALGATGVITKPFDPSGFCDEVRRFIPLAGVLSAAREHFLMRLNADACALSAYRPRLSERSSKDVLRRIEEIAHALAGAGGIYGFAGITSESAALSDAAKRNLAGRAARADVEQALDRLLKRLNPSGDDAGRSSSDARR